MGVACFIVLDAEEPGFDPFVNGKAVAADADAVNRIADRLGLQRFESYLCQDLSEFDVPQPATEWFAAEEGLRWSRALKEYVAEHPDSVRDATGIIADLDEYAKVFDEARTRGLRWHFELDY